MNDKKLCDWLGVTGELLSAGSHRGKEGMCVLEAVALQRGMEKTDNPVTLRTWDLRNLNDIKVPDQLRTEYMCQVVDTYQNCRDWPLVRQVEVASRLAILTVNRLIAELPGLSPEIARACRIATTTEAASAAMAEAVAEVARAAAAARTPVVAVAEAAVAAEVATWAARASAAAVAAAVAAEGAAAVAAVASSTAAAATSAVAWAASTAAAAAVAAVEAAEMWVEEAAASAAASVANAASRAETSALRAANAVVVFVLACSCWLDAAKEGKK